MTTQANLTPRLIVEHVYVPCNWQVGDVIEINTSVLSIGRTNQHEVRIDHTEVSRQHAEISYEGELCFIRDAGSHNGTFLNGIRLVADQHRPLKQDDQIQIGQQIVFRFEDPNATTTAQAERVHLGDLDLDLVQRDVYVNGQTVTPRLTPIQFSLLELFVKPSESKAFAFDEIIAAVWPEAVGGEGVTMNAIHTLVSDVRQRLEPYSDDHQYIENLRGHGYRFVPRPSSQPSAKVSE